MKNKPVRKLNIIFGIVLALSIIIPLIMASVVMCELSKDIPGRGGVDSFGLNVELAFSLGMIPILVIFETALYCIIRFILEQKFQSPQSPSNQKAQR